MIFLTGFSLWAQSPHLMLAAGPEWRPEKDLENKTSIHTLSNYALGAGFRDYLFILEKSSFEESSGNAALNVERRLESIMLWGEWRAPAWKAFVPYLGGGLGAYQEIVKTNLPPAPSTTRETSHKMLTGLNFGLQLEIPILWLSLEGRLLFGDELDPQPTLGALARVGLWF
ncbi:MAG: hypothetical protein ACAH59_09015 [Pseudobdellovibrionaceae bacterium]